MALKAKLRKYIPRELLSAYHAGMALGVAAWYGFPGLRLTIVGVTGTKGKTTTSAMLWHILRGAGMRCGLISTALISIGDSPKISDLKMTTPSRAKLQQLLRSMVRAGCTHVVVETSSEALAQWRHLGLNYRVAVFTNLTPEHIESHGSLAHYRAAKGKLFETVARNAGTTIINLDDAETPFFLLFPAHERYGFSLKHASVPGLSQTFQATAQKVTPRHARFMVSGTQVELPVGGEFNIYNALAALSAAAALKVPLVEAAKSLASFPGTPGRLEFIEAGQSFQVVVDYAHTPESLEAVYHTLRANGQALIAVLGSCGGGRDKAKREPLGRLAGTHARVVIVTNEDPYDEDPRLIMEAVAVGARAAGKYLGENLFVIEDRREAIRKALQLAQVSDTVIITGKGAEQWLCVAGNKKIPWDDRTVVREELKQLLKSTSIA